jgi:hypothetical protein
MSLSLFPEEILEVIAEQCAALQKEDDVFYETTHPLLNRGAGALSMTSSTLRRVCLPLLFRTIILRQISNRRVDIDAVLEKLFGLINAKKHQHIAQYIRYVRISAPSSGVDTC